MDKPDNPGEWHTYVQAAQRLHKSIGAIRQMALRGKLQRVHSNDGKALVFITSEHARAVNEQPERAANEQPERIAHVQPEHAAHVRRPDSSLVHALQSHISTLQADVEALKEQLTAERTTFAAREAAFAANLTAEKARTDQAIAAFAALAERLDALAATNQRAKPWWRRALAG